LFGVKRNDIQSYIDNGFIVPSIHRAYSRKEMNLFSADDIVGIIAIRRLSDIGLSRRKAAELVRNTSNGDIVWLNSIVGICIDFNNIKKEIDALVAT
tara:strand:+ start:3027 stop:3317 length:291 start_codon:yes stop_codon:yes gene_type:complete